MFFLLCVFFFKFSLYEMIRVDMKRPLIQKLRKLKNVIMHVYFVYELQKRFAYNALDII